jgi:RNA polymerase sigma factor FliA
MHAWRPPGPWSKSGPRFGRCRQTKVEVLEHELGRLPTEAELADAVGITTRELGEALAAITRSAFIALDATLALVDTTGDHLTLLDTVADPHAPDPFAALDAAQRRERVMAAVARLPERERTVVALYYYEGLKLREISDILGVVESRVSQLRTRAMLHLRGVVARDELVA